MSAVLIARSARLTRELPNASGKGPGMPPISRTWNPPRSTGLVDDERVELDTRSQWHAIHARHTTPPLTAQRGSDEAAGTSEVKDARTLMHGFNGRRMRTRVVELRLVLRGVGRRKVAIETAVVEETHPLRSRAQHGLDDIGGVLQSVDMADFVAVVGRDRQLPDA